MLSLYLASVNSLTFNLSSIFWSGGGSKGYSKLITNDYTRFEHKNSSAGFAITSSSTSNFESGRFYKLSCGMSIQGEGKASFFL